MAPLTGLLARGSDDVPSFPVSQWLQANLSAYSCGGSRGINRRFSLKPAIAPHSLLALLGHLRLCNYIPRTKMKATGKDDSNQWFCFCSRSPVGKILVLIDSTEFPPYFTGIGPSHAMARAKRECGAPVQAGNSAAAPATVSGEF